MTETWVTGEMLCFGCGNDNGAIHVWLEGSEPVECELCGEMLMVPKSDEEED